jgi:hypothetical protein
MDAPTCDRCCAAPLDTWLHSDIGDDSLEPSARTLTLCRHHSRENQCKLYDQGFRLVEVAPVPA